MHYLLHLFTIVYQTLHMLTEVQFTSNFQWSVLHIASVQWSALHFTPLYQIALHFTYIHWKAIHLTYVHWSSIHYTTLHIKYVHWNALHFTKIDLTLYLVLGVHCSLRARCIVIMSGSKAQNLILIWLGSSAHKSCGIFVRLICVPSHHCPHLYSCSVRCRLTARAQLNVANFPQYYSYNTL